MKKLLASVVIAAALSGCEPGPSSSSPDWQASMNTHTCTSEQMVKVEKETKFCVEETDFFSSYCYGTAIIRNCENRHERTTIHIGATDSPPTATQ